MLRRLRSAMSLATIWAVVWLPVGVIVGLILTRVVSPGQSWRDFFGGLAVWTLVGGISGAVFALFLAVFERNRTINQLSPGRLSLWGAIGGGVLPVTVTLVIVRLIPSIHLANVAPLVFALMAALGVACALGTLWVARRPVT